MIDPSLFSIPGLHDETLRLAREWYAAYVRAAAWDGPVLDWDQQDGAAREWGITAQEALLCDLARAESRDFWLRWLAAGARWTKRDKMVGVEVSGAAMRADLDANMPPSQWKREPHDCGWMRDGGALSIEQSAAAIAWSVRSVAAGGVPLRDVWTAWGPYSSDALKRTSLRSSNVTVILSGAWPAWATGWELKARPGHAAGPETGTAGKLASSAAALAAGYGLLDDAGALTLPPLPEIDHVAR